MRSDDEIKSNYIVDDIICNLDLSNLDVKNVKDKLVSKSMEAFRLYNLEELLTDAIHKSAVVVSETGEESNKVPVAVESTSDTTLSTAQSDSDWNWLLFRKIKRRSEFMSLLIL